MKLESKSPLYYSMEYPNRMQTLAGAGILALRSGLNDELKECLEEIWNQSTNITEHKINGNSVYHGLN